MLLPKQEIKTSSVKSGTTFSGTQFQNCTQEFSTKLYTTFFQHVFNHYVNFQSKWTTNVEMTVALKLGVEKSNIVDTSNIGCVWHALCTYCILLKLRNAWFVDGAKLS